MCYYFDQFPQKPPRKIVNMNGYSVKVKQVKKALQIEVIFNLYCRSNVVKTNLKAAFFLIQRYFTIYKRYKVRPQHLLQDMFQQINRDVPL